MTIIPILVALLPAPASQVPFRDLTFAEAVNHSKEERKPIFIDFYLSDCKPCRLLDETTWKDAAVSAWIGDHTVPIKLNAELEPDLVMHLGVKSYPTLLLLRSDGTQIGSLVGYRSAKDFLVEIQDVMAGVEPRSGKPERLRARLKEAEESVRQAPTNPVERLTLAELLLELGQYDQALLHYLWCWDFGLDYSRSFAGVRGSFLLSDIARLAISCPQANLELSMRRASIESQLLDPDVSVERAKRAAADLRSLDRSFFGQPEKTLQLLDFLKDARGDTDTAVVALRSVLVRPLIEKGRYDEAIMVKRDYVALVRHQFEVLRRRYGSFSGGVLPGHSNTLVEGGFPYFELYAGVGSEEEAHSIAKILIDYAPVYSTFNGLVLRAKKAKAGSVALSVLELARDVLEGDEFSELESTCRWAR